VSLGYQASPSVVLSALLLIDKPWFLTEEKDLPLCSSYFPLGVSQLPGHNHHQLHASHQPHDQEKDDGSQEPTLWLSDYLQAVQILGGTRATTMQSLQLHLTGAARSWLNTLPNDSIRGWGN
jgi:hypothetical protein